MVKSSQRNSLIEKHRYINVDYDNWWDCVESDFVEDMKKVGIEVSMLYFSGFCSQGDGACFTGSLCDAKVYLDHHHVDQFPMIRKLLEHGGDVWAISRHSGRYYHHMSTTISADHDLLFNVIDTPTEFHLAIVEEWDRLLGDEMADFEAALTEQWRTYMQDVYRKLEEEYDHLTSDEAVWDTIEANELEEDIDDDEDDYDRAA